MTFICTINNQDYIFNKQKSLLENLEAHALSPEFQCRDGHCGACRSLLIKGQVSYPQQPIVYLRNNEILTGCSQADDNIEIKI
ncbi:ferredoxin [Psychromonas sp. PRT-SC03]|nr:ferredoxin [Psychromonas sp. PRT-SC03]